MTPRLSFFCELDGDAFLALARRDAVVRPLRALGARVTMGLRDLSEARAEAVRCLHDASIPVDAWLLLDRADGYFATHHNAAAVEARVDAFLRWRDGLPITSLGFDFEPPLQRLERLFEDPLRGLAGLVHHRTRADHLAAARERYAALVGRLQALGLRVESYQFPLLWADREASSRFFQRAAGALDLPVDREVAMAYSSLLGPFGAGLVEQTAARVQAIAVGSTGGGVDPLPPLTFASLRRDLLVAAHMCRDVSIFSLEGCVTRDFLEPLTDLDWGARVDVGVVQRTGATALRVAAVRLAKLAR